MAIQCRADDQETVQLLSALEDRAVRQATTAERTFLAALGGGCSLPVGAYAQVEGDLIDCEVVVAAPDGSQVLRFRDSATDAQVLGRRLAEEALAHGAQEVLNA